MCVCVYIRIEGSSSNPNDTTLETQRPQHGRLYTCVIAQQYSSATSVSLRFHSLKRSLKNALISIILNLVKSRASKIALHENAYVGNCLYGEKQEVCPSRDQFPVASRQNIGNRFSLRDKAISRRCTGDTHIGKE